MIRPVLVVCVSVSALFGLSCVPRSEGTGHGRVWNVAPRELHKAYVAGDDERWDGQTVRVYIDAKNYECGVGAVHWIAGRPTDAPDIVFRCDAVPADNLKPVTVVGTVKGKTADTEKRSSGRTWHVAVERCSVTVR